MARRSRYQRPVRIGDPLRNRDLPQVERRGAGYGGSGRHATATQWESPDEQSLGNHHPDSDPGLQGEPGTQRRGRRGLLHDPIRTAGPTWTK